MATYYEPLTGKLMEAPDISEINNLPINTAILSTDDNVTIPVASFCGGQECYLTIQGSTTFRKYTTPSAAALFAAVGAGTYKLRIHNDNTEPLQLLAGSGVTLDGRAGMYIMCTIYNNRELLVNVVSATEVTITSIGDIPCMVRFQQQEGSTGFVAETSVVAGVTAFYFSSQSLNVYYSITEVYDSGINNGGYPMGDIWLFISQRGSSLFLSCNDQQLTTLDVTECLGMTLLYCEDNVLTTLDVTECPAMNTLYCGNNALTVLDVTKNPNLSELSCRANNLTTLDVTECPVLYYLDCSGNTLTTLDLTECPDMHTLDCYLNSLTESAVDAMLVTLAAGSVGTGNCGLSGNAAPSATGLAAITTLQGRDWDVYAGGPLESLVINEEEPLIVAVGSYIYHEVTATFDDETTMDVTYYVHWASNHPEYATVSLNGTITGISDGEAIITASHRSISDTATVTVITP